MFQSQIDFLVSSIFRDLGQMFDNFTTCSMKVLLLEK